MQVKEGREWAKLMASFQVSGRQMTSEFIYILLLLFFESAGMQAGWGRGGERGRENLNQAQCSEWSSLGAQSLNPEIMT